MKLIFATNNPHKIEEAKAILGDSVELISLDEVGCHDDRPETSPTLEGNSRQKAEFIYNRYHADCFADDTGLEVDALGGAPGVYSARYAGTDGKHPTPADNRKKLLSQMNGITNRNARFRTVVTLIKNGKQLQAEGIVDGKIATEERGNGGFGYDSLFIPDGYDHTFAELGEQIKNSISHRARAMQALAQLLNT